MGTFCNRMRGLRIGIVFATSIVTTSAFSLSTPFPCVRKGSFCSANIIRKFNVQPQIHERLFRALPFSMSVDPSFSKQFAEKHQVIQDFLTQRSVQTLMHSMKLVGDTASLEFLESFCDHQGLSRFHGYGGLRVDSASYINGLQRSVPVVVVKRKKFYRGGSPNNPYVTDSEFSFSTTIQPRTLAANIIAMREIIAKECVEDLSLIASENADLWRHHEEVVRNREDRGSMLLPPRHEDSDENSPLRLATYDLLEKMATDAAAQRVAESFLRGPVSGRHAGRWLREQYILAGTGFQGDHGEDVGRKFMLHLLNAMPVIVTGGDSGVAAIVDPLDVAQRVMHERERLAAQWAEGLRETASYHAQWATQLLESCLMREADRAREEKAAPPPRPQEPAPAAAPRRKKYRVVFISASFLPRAGRLSKGLSPRAADRQGFRQGPASKGGKQVPPTRKD